MSGLQAHLAGGVTTLARLWRLERRDGGVLGFTDHDQDLWLEGERYEAAGGLTGRALSRTTGLSVDNTEVSGALRSDALREEDLLAGRYDGALVRILLVNWQDLAQQQVLFRGHLGEVSRREGAFRAELRGQSEALSLTQDQIYQRSCTAVLGDRRCGKDLSGSEFTALRAVQEQAEGRIFRFDTMGSYADRWFERGALQVLSGPASGLQGVIRNDRLSGGWREIELWDRIGIALQPGDQVKLVAGCDRAADTCRGKFGNFLNFRGFPHLPTEDWLLAAPGTRQ